MNLRNKKWVVVVLLWMLCVITCIVYYRVSNTPKNSENQIDPVVQVHESTPPTALEMYYTPNQYSEYPTACIVWQTLRCHGYNPYVSAGILGNMMTECGGHTLDLQHSIYDSSGRYYGLCQWSLKYTPQVQNLDVHGQLDVLLSNIQINIEYFGGDFNYFLNLQDEKEAAYYFQHYYERGLGTESRSTNATIAFNYFTS